MVVSYYLHQRVQGVETHLFQKVDRYSLVNSSTFTILYGWQNFNIHLTYLPFRSTICLCLPDRSINLQRNHCPGLGAGRPRVADRLGQQFGNYRLIALLGQGSYAEVYLGQHVRLELQAAIKVLHGHLTSSEAERFQQEAQTMERLTHPSIVRVFDFDVQDGIPFLIMEYAPNGSLRRRYPEGSIVSLPEIIPSIKQVAAALQYAHEQKFIHRDVKPENMLLGRQQEVLLSDFGLAALARSTASLSTQGTVGTIAYIAPEQIEGHPRAASDQYALAVAIYEWLCGERPFGGSATEVIVKQLGAPPPPLREHVPTISAEVEQVVLRALAKDPKERFASVAAFAAELERASQLASSHPSLPPMEQPSPEPSASTIASSPNSARSASASSSVSAPTMLDSSGPYRTTLHSRVRVL
jgi:eukaryotic-like serine/threonine-protein kinase